MTAFVGLNPSIQPTFDMYQFLTKAGRGRTHTIRPPRPATKIVDMSVADLGNGRHETWVLAYQGKLLYVAVKRGKMAPTTVPFTDPSTWSRFGVDGTKPVVCDPEHVYPKYKPEWTMFKLRERETMDAVYKRHHTLLETLMTPEMSDFVPLANQEDLEARAKRTFAREVTTHEIEACEKLAKYPHPHIAEYRGVMTSTIMKINNRECRYPIDVDLRVPHVFTLVFKRYYCTLQDLINGCVRFNVLECLEMIAAAIDYLHGLGVIHSDINPRNIYVQYTPGGSWDRRYTFVLGSFDSAQETGKPLKFWLCDPGWSREKDIEKDIAEEEDDWFSFYKLKRYLARYIGAVAGSYAHVGKPVRVIEEFGGDYP